METENNERTQLDDILNDTVDTSCDDTADISYPSVTEEILSLVW